MSRCQWSVSCTSHCLISKNGWSEWLSHETITSLQQALMSTESRYSRHVTTEELSERSQNMSSQRLHFLSLATRCETFHLKSCCSQCNPSVNITLLGFLLLYFVVPEESHQLRLPTPGNFRVRLLQKRALPVTQLVYLQSNRNW